MYAQKFLTQRCRARGGREEEGKGLLFVSVA